MDFWCWWYSFVYGALLQETWFWASPISSHMILVMVHVSYLENLFHFVLEKTHFKNMTFINTPSKRKEKKVKRRTEQTFVLVLTFPKICYNFLEAFLIIIHDQNAQTNRRIIESSITFRQHGLTFFLSIHLSKTNC